MSKQIQNTRRPTHVSNITSLKILHEFVEKLEKAFSMTDFSLLKMAITPSPYSFSFNAEMEEEGSYGKEASQEVQSFKAPTNKPTKTSTEFRWEWNTSSDHILILEGELPGEHIDKIDVSIYVGTEASSCFYPTIKDIIKKGIGVPIF